MRQRVVFDTTTVVSDMLFSSGRLAWLRKYWCEPSYTPLISCATATELTRVLGYPKFRLTVEDRRELLAEYLPCCETVKVMTACEITCRDAQDQMFLDLAQIGEASVLVSGDRDLLALVGETRFRIEMPEVFRRSVAAS